MSDVQYSQSDRDTVVHALRNLLSAVGVCSVTERHAHLAAAPKHTVKSVRPILREANLETNSLRHANTFCVA